MSTRPAWLPKEYSTGYFNRDGHPSRYQPRPTALNFGEHMGTGVFPLMIAVPLANRSSRKWQEVSSYFRELPELLELSYWSYKQYNLKKKKRTALAIFIVHFSRLKKRNKNAICSSHLVLAWYGANRRGWCGRGLTGWTYSKRQMGWKIKRRAKGSNRTQIRTNEVTRVQLRLNRQFNNEKKYEENTNPNWSKEII